MKNLCIHKDMFVKLNNLTGCTGCMWHFEEENAMCAEVVAGTFRIWS